jgi:uncharacterized protein YecE (DUF72 family)
MIYIGTSGYSYKDWIGPFYPEGTKDTAMLTWYSQEFQFLEVKSTYYHMPGLRLFESINNKTADNFRVAVKLFKGFTHERNLGAPEAQNFVNALRPLAESGKLLTLLAQFPYSFHFTKESVEHLRRLRDWFPGVEVNVEFRNEKWIRQETMDFLRKENFGYVCVDEPKLRGLIGNSVLAATSKVAYLRMHGRNAARWYEGEGSERYDYLYSEEELLEWMPRIRELEDNSSAMVIAFNNHPFGKAVVNARALAEYLQK